MNSQTALSKSVKKWPVWILMLALVWGCTPEKSREQRRLEEVENLVDRLSVLDLSILGDVTISARRDDNGHYKARCSFYRYMGNHDILIPVFDGCHSEEEILNPKEFGIFKMAELEGVPRDSAVEYVKNYSSKVVALFDKVDIFRVYGHPSDGGVISFYFNERNFVAYIPDQSRLRPYWKSFCKTAKKVTEGWYYELEKLN